MAERLEEVLFIKCNLNSYVYIFFLFQSICLFGVVSIGNKSTDFKMVYKYLRIELVYFQVKCTNSGGNFLCSNPDPIIF